MTRARWWALGSAGAGAVVAAAAVMGMRGSPSPSQARTRCTPPSWVAKVAVGGGTGTALAIASEVSREFAGTYPLVAIDVTTLGRNGLVHVYRSPAGAVDERSGYLPDDAVAGSLLAAFEAARIPIVGVGLRSWSPSAGCRFLDWFRSSPTSGENYGLPTAREVRSASVLADTVRRRLAERHLTPTKIVAVAAYGGFVRVEFPSGALAGLGPPSGSFSLYDLVGRENLTLGYQVIESARPDAVVPDPYREESVPGVDSYYGGVS